MMRLLIPTRYLLALLFLGSSHALADSVIRENREWLQPADFRGYSWEEVADTCPEGICFGFLPGSDIDLTGFLWASIDDVNSLFNSYHPIPLFGPGPNSRGGGGLVTDGSNLPRASLEFLNSYEPDSILLPLNQGLIGWVSDPYGTQGSSTYQTAGYNQYTSRSGPVSFTYYTGGAGIRPAPFDDYDIGAWFWRPSPSIPGSIGVEASCRLDEPGRPRLYRPTSAACEEFEGTATAMVDLADGALTVTSDREIADAKKMADAGLVDLITIVEGWDVHGNVKLEIEIEVESRIMPVDVDGGITSFVVVAWPMGGPTPPCLYDFNLCSLDRLDLPFSAAKFYANAQIIESSGSPAETFFNSEVGEVLYQRILTLPIQVSRTNPSFYLGLSASTRTFDYLGKQGLTAKLTAIHSASGGLEFSARRVLGSSLPGTQSADSKAAVSGKVRNESGEELCAMVLANGQYMFSCDPLGQYALSNLSRGEGGEVSRQIYADGHLARIDILPGSVHEDVTLSSTGLCTNYNEPFIPTPTPELAGTKHRISGKILSRDTTTPVCALVLVNGEHMFSCNGEGGYDLDFPLDENGQFTLQVYADGFAPAIQRLDTSSTGGVVRLASATQCR